jgi:hypothetical protein
MCAGVEMQNILIDNKCRLDLSFRIPRRNFHVIRLPIAIPRNDLFVSDSRAFMVCF